MIQGEVVPGTYILSNVTTKYNAVLQIDKRSRVFRRMGRGFQRHEIAKVKMLVGVCIKKRWWIDSPYTCEEMLTVR